MKNPRYILASLAVIVSLASSSVWAQEGPNRPQPKPVTLDGKTTAILVLDLHSRCEDPKEICAKLMPGLGEFLEKVRPSGVFIVYTVSSEQKGKPTAEIAAPLKRRASEPVIYPQGFDKFIGGELEGLLKPKGIKSVVIVGASAHIAVLHTAAARPAVTR